MERAEHSASTQAAYRSAWAARNPPPSLRT